MFHNTKSTLISNNLVVTTNGDAQPIERFIGYSLYASWTDITPAAKSFYSAAKASVVITDLTYTADTAGAAGNSITVEYTGGATHGNEVVTIVSSAKIKCQIEDGVSTATEVKTAIDAYPAAAALVDITITGTGSNAQNITAETALTGGVTSSLNLTAETITISTHGFVSYIKGQFTTTGTLPTGITTSTNYWLIVTSANIFQVADSLAHAQAGTYLNLSAEGTGTHTFTPTGIAGAIKLQRSEDGTTYHDFGTSTTVNITGTGSTYWNGNAYTTEGIYFDKVMPVVTMTAGYVAMTVSFVGKGYQLP